MALHNPSPVHEPHGEPAGEPPDRNKRRGVTSIEYVFMLSLIIVACILGIQHVGEITKSFFTTSAEKTKIMDPSQQGGSK